MKTLIGYKVVKKRSLVSSTVFVGRIKYKLNCWVTPQKNCGPLCVFKDMENDVNFIGVDFGDLYTIYKCIYESSKERKIYTEGFKYYGRVLGRLPQGTVLADRVKLIKKEI